MPRDAAKRIVMAAWLLHGPCVGEEAGARNLAFSRKVAAGGDERYLECATVAAAIVSSSYQFPIGVLQHVVVHVVLFASWNLWLPIALEWPHDCCHLVLPCA